MVVHPRQVGRNLHLKSRLQLLVVYEPQNGMIQMGRQVGGLSIGCRQQEMQRLLLATRSCLQMMHLRGIHCPRKLTEATMQGKPGGR